MDTYAVWKEEAVQKFGAALRDKIDWLADRCWEQNILAYLGDLNKILGAGRRFGVTQAENLSEQKFAELTQEILDLRALGMKEAVKATLVQVLKDLGVDETALMEPKEAAA